MDAWLSTMRSHAYYLRKPQAGVNFMDQSTPSRHHPLRGLRVLVTGGTSGLGRALVDELHQHGASVAFVARSEAAVARVAQEVPHALGIAGDVADKQAIHRIALQALGWRGGLDVLVNNASSLGPVPLAPLADTDCEAFEEALDTNVLGPFRLTKALLGALAASAREGRGGVVVNVSSDAAVNAYPNWGAYGASKAALLHMTRIWNEECAALGIRLLSFDPGDMDTPLHKLAVPEADPATLRRPRASARALVHAVAEAVRRARPADSDARTERAAASA
jgi:NAD(P)-dependent dehydrogenase (short-subunit alcohol dehydrogenase family)